jgi:hypothetical protein
MNESMDAPNQRFERAQTIVPAFNSNADGNGRFREAFLAAAVRTG